MPDVRQAMGGGVELLRAVGAYFHQGGRRGQEGPLESEIENLVHAIAALRTEDAASGDASAPPPAEEVYGNRGVRENGELFHGGSRRWRDG